MKDINVIVLLCRLTKDADIQEKNNNTLVKFSVAYNRSMKSNGVWSDKSNFIDCIYWGELAKAVHPYLKKGTQIVVDGELEHQNWEDNNGNRKSKHAIVCKTIRLCGGTEKTGAIDNNTPAQNNTVFDEDGDGFF